MTGNFDEAFVETQIVTNRILPSLFVVAIIWKMFHDVLVDSIQSQSFLGTISDSQHDESIV